MASEAEGSELAVVEKRQNEANRVTASKLFRTCTWDDRTAKSTCQTNPILRGLTVATGQMPGPDRVPRQSGARGGNGKRETEAVARLHASIALFR